MSDIDDGSTKPLGHQTDDGELEVRETDGERIYHETELGQHMRWMRQAPDLFALYQEAKVYESHLRLVMMERDKLRDALTKIAEFSCECHGYYRCGNCPQKLSSIAEDALSV